MSTIPVAVFESFDPHRRFWSHVFERPQAVHFARNLSEVLPLLEEADQVAHKGLWAALMVSYEAAPAFDIAMEVHPSDGFPLAWLAVFREPSSTWRTCGLPTEEVSSPTWIPLIARETYEAGIGTTRSAIARGDCY